MSVTSLAITVSGRVQGVWYRASAKAKADELGIAGTVRNLPDGTVYIEATGPADQLEAFVIWCNDGPELARVDHVAVENLDDLLAVGFQIVR